jgi:hypothetical protein
MVLLLVAAAFLLLRVAAWKPDLARFAALPAVLLCVFAGLDLPDLDHPLPLDHRSAVTHSIAPALLPLLRRWSLPVAAGLALGIALHLAADVFPNGMTGYAMVKLPFAGSIGAGPSYVWLGANAAACALLGGWLIQSRLPGRQGLAAAGAALLIGLVYLLSVDGGWWALLVLGAGTWAALRVRRAWA